MCMTVSDTPLIHKTHSDTATEHAGESTATVGVHGVGRGHAESVVQALGQFARFRKPQNFAAMSAEVRVVTGVHVRKPHAQEFIRTNQTLILDALTFVRAEDSRLYVMHPTLEAGAPVKLRPTRLIGTINNRAKPEFFFWPLVLQDGAQPWNDWHKSAYAAAQHAENRWVRVESNLPGKAYDVHYPTSKLPEPVWPPSTLEALLDLALASSVIDDNDHIVLKKLRGET